MRYSSKILICSVVFFVSLIFVSGNVDAWFDSSWTYRRNITVNVGRNVDNYAIPINITNTTGMDPQGDDLRFTDINNNSLYAWKDEALSVDGQYFYVYVKGNFTTANGTQIQMYYNKSGASPNWDFVNTFYGADGTFSTSTGWDTSKQGTMLAINTSQGKLNFTDYPGNVNNIVIFIDLGANNNYTQSDFIVDYDFNITGTVQSRPYMGPMIADNTGYFAEVTDGPQNGYNIFSGNYGGELGGCGVQTADTITNDVTGATPISSNTIYYVRAIRTGTTWNASYYDNATARAMGWNPIETVQVTGGPSGTMRYFDAISFYDVEADTNNGWFDNVILRPYDSDSSYSIDVQEILSGGGGDNPPTITLNQPVDDDTLAYKSNIAFNFTPSDDGFFANCSLWTNETSWGQKELNASDIINGSLNTILESFASYGDYLWNIECYDNGSNRAFATANYTLHLADDPPSATSESPADGTNHTTNFVIVNCSATDTLDIANLSLWGNWGGGWHRNATVTVPGDTDTYNTTTWEVNVPDGNWTWGCEVFDNASQSSFSSNKSFRVVTTPLYKETETFLNQSKWISEIENVSFVTLYGEKYGGNPVITPDQAWEGNAITFPSVLYIDGVYHMWYGCISDPVCGAHATRTCYANSTDGITWTKPNLGLSVYGGSSNNNIVLDWGRMVSISYNASSNNASRKYIAVSNYRDIEGEAGIFYSSDGLHWQNGSFNRITSGTSVTHEGYFLQKNRTIGSLTTWDQDWILWAKYTGGDTLRRIKMYYNDTTVDGNWTEYGAITSINDGVSSTDERHHMSTSYYAGYYYGFIGQFRDDISPERGNVTLWYSEDAHNWVYIGKILNHSDATAWDDAWVFFGHDPINQSGTNATNWTVWYAGLNVSSDCNFQIGKATWRKEGFTALKLDDGKTEGYITTYLINATATSGSTMWVNVNSTYGSLKIELLYPNGTTIAGYEKTSFDTISDSKTRKTVSWGGDTTLPSSNFKIRFWLHNADAELFSFGFFGAPTGGISILQPQNISYWNNLILPLNVTSIGDAVIDTWLYSFNGQENISFVPNSSIESVVGQNNITVWANDSVSGVWYSDTVFWTWAGFKCNSSFVGDTICGGDGFKYRLFCRKFGKQTYQWDTGNMSYCKGGCYDGYCIEDLNPYNHRCNQTQTICIDAFHYVNCTLTDAGYYDWNESGIYCQHGCFDGKCLTEFSTCIPGESKCVEKSIVYCDDPDGDGNYDWSATNTTYCNYGCKERNVNGKLEAYCNYHSFGTMEALRNQLTSFGMVFDVTFSDYITLKLFVFMLIAVLLGGLIGSKVNWRLGYIGFIGAILIGTMVNWVPLYVSIMFLILSILLFKYGGKSEDGGERE